MFLVLTVPFYLLLLNASKNKGKKLDSFPYTRGVQKIMKNNTP